MQVPGKLVWLRGIKEVPEEREALVLMGKLRARKGLAVSRERRAVSER